ncbi:unnamed protein product [Cochlearia groenlandica]
MAEEEEANIEKTVFEEEDRISALHDDLLVKIMLSLSTKDAVATMVLSKRWQFIWMILPSLAYKKNKCINNRFFCCDDGDDDEDDETKRSTWWFLDKSMQLHKAPVLQTLLIKLGPGCPIDADVGKWLAKAVSRRVAVIKFKLSWSTGPLRLPNSLYTCETLKELSLTHKILVDFPSSSCLPSLRTLDLLNVVYKDDASLSWFLSNCCPILELLNVDRNKNDNVAKFSVKVPSLLTLWYDNNDDNGHDDVVLDNDRCLVIDTPALIEFWITDYSRDSCLIQNNMPRLLEAHIHVLSFLDIVKSKKPLSSVFFLELYMTNQVIVLCSTINFYRLVKLSISPHRSDWIEPLLLLLENAPQLEHLMVNYELTDEPHDEIPLSWKQPTSIPPKCLSSQLKTFEYREYGAREEEEDFLTYVLATSKFLDTVTISMRPTFNLDKKEFIIHKLTDIHRVSSTSQLFFKPSCYFF